MVLGAATFVGLRSVDLFLQYKFLRSDIVSSIVHKLGYEVVSQGPPFSTGFCILDPLNLSLQQMTFMGLLASESVSQSVSLCMWNAPIQPRQAAKTAIGHAIMNSVNTFMFINRSTSAATHSNSLSDIQIAGLGLYVIGLSIELWAKKQKRSFEQDPRNDGQLCTRGLWKYAQHVDYGGTILRKSGMAMFSGGITWALATAGIACAYLRHYVVPELHRRFSQLVGFAYNSCFGLANVDSTVSNGLNIN